MFNWIGGDGLGEINSWNGEADGEGMFGGVPKQDGILELTQALTGAAMTPGPLDVMPGQSGFGNNSATNPMRQDASPMSMLNPNQGTARPIEVDEIQMKQSGGDLEQMTGGGGNQAARIGAGIGNLFNLYGGSKGWF